MQTDTLTPVSWRAKPCSFVALMALYESNHVRLGWLAGNLRRLEGHHVSVVASDCELHLTVRERSPYTTTLDLNYSLLQVPDLRVRVYHDANLCEAQDTGAERASKSASTSAPTPLELADRWSRNVLLNKWLEYCVDRGHRFGSAASREIRL